jgi:NAD(P)-dependent dehydrogenase (short-subunit alcohol dehydrogenase family)
MELSKFALTDKVAIITGSGRGIGKGIALAFADVGADVVVVARTAADIEATASEIGEKGSKALAVPGDVRQSDQVENLVQKTLEEFGRIDILVNNAGGTFGILAMDMSENAWDAIVRENLKTVFLCSKAVAEVMLDQKKGSIVNISSQAGRGASPRLSAYGASKAGIINLTQSLAAEWAPYVRVNCIAPGWIETPGVKGKRRETEEEDVNASTRMEELSRNIPLGRLGRPDDIAAAAIYLASNAAEWVTGITIDVAGGPVRGGM